MFKKGPEKCPKWGSPKQLKMDEYFQAVCHYSDHFKWSKYLIIEYLNPYHLVVVKLKEIDGFVMKYLKIFPAGLTDSLTKKAYEIR